ncbi:hypothetical protein EJ02DRAFT_16214 [Clathrospora elynae]|uniref:Uncharacterized protein n=1 Tax=Clathrospora elynae TaxID=706981 RepID=A0A6A5SFS5_9PLEO|nr:hypothetical protein EJ02DRAFT_16214 [Clathrospora elynae]
MQSHRRVRRAHGDNGVGGSHHTLLEQKGWDRHFFGTAPCATLIGTSAITCIWSRRITPPHVLHHHNILISRPPPVEPRRRDCARCIFTTSFQHLFWISKATEQALCRFSWAVRYQLSTSICGYATFTDWTASAPNPRHSGYIHHNRGHGQS